MRYLEGLLWRSFQDSSREPVKVVGSRVKSDILSKRGEGGAWSGLVGDGSTRSIPT